MKTMKIITTLCWVVTALAIAGLAVWFLTGTVFGLRISGKNDGSPFGLNFSAGDWGVLSGSYSLDGSYKVNASGLDTIDINWLSGGITVAPHNGADIQINEYARRELTSAEKVSFDTSGSVLTIEYCEHSMNINMPSKRLEVLIPQELCERLAGFVIDSTSGSIYVDNLFADSFKIKSVSGSVNITGIAAKSFDVRSTSGSISIEDTHTETANIHSTSGSVDVSSSEAAALDCKTTSGRINIDGSFGSANLDSTSGRISVENDAADSSIDAKTTSGSITITGAYSSAQAKSGSGSVKISSAIIPSKLSVQTTSGSITVEVPDNETIEVYHSTTSGRFSSEVPILMQGRGAQFELSSTSGSIRITAFD